MTESLLTYALIFSILVLSGTVILLVGYYLNALKRISLHNKDALRSSETVLDHAREKAHEIIMAAHNRARDVVSENKLFEGVLQDAQKEELQKASDQLVTQYKQAFEELSKEYIDMFKTISKDIEISASSEVEDFKNMLRRETLESQKIVGEKIDKLYADTQVEVEEYKKQELQKVKDNIYQIIQNAASLAIGRNIDLEAHENLIIDALNEAVQNQEFKSK